ncbi:MAG TPA: ornithine cyclodeaminase family protein [Chloroflexota bacterium]|nr:ornithine cyclodeaminase family protein [Chloroflexota bacterium]
MTLFIGDSEINRVLPMADCIAAMERAFAEEARGEAANQPRARYKVPPDPNVPGYMANIIAGAVPSSGVAALRYDSTVVQERVVHGQKRLDWLMPSRRSWGFVLLFSLATGEPLALIQDFSLSALRVGATTGVAVRALARRDATRVGLLGSGNEARRNLEAICLVRKVRAVKVYSPNAEHRREFAEEMTERLGVEVQMVGSAREAIEDADVIMSATSASQPVFDGAWLRPGQMVITIANTDGVHRRTEADDTTMERCDLLVLNSRQTLLTNQQRELLDLIDAGRVSWDKITELGQVVAGQHPGRTSDAQIVYYKSNTGVGIQFAAAGALIYEACKQQGLGHEVPTEWFGADLGGWLDRGFNPSP